ncbi:hypothetical protein FQN57_002148 [Myotisia sp. PD_48]|nr:hypothetical protein FQN57_002148 [Myotisia sp. PD_48]
MATVGLVLTSVALKPVYRHVMRRQNAVNLLLKETKNVHSTCAVPNGGFVVLPKLSAGMSVNPDAQSQPDRPVVVLQLPSGMLPISKAGIGNIPHLYYAFAQINPVDKKLFFMNSYDGEFYRAFTDLKKTKPSLKCYLAVGGWAAGGTIFSEMADTKEHRKAFIDSVKSTLAEYNFDGVDIDWEYPMAEDRGGKKEDFKNYVLLLKELKEAFAGKYGLTVAVPGAYWYLRGFDIQQMIKYADWFHVMSYDIHGTWDGQSKWTQPEIRPHTNVTEISSGLDLLWRNSIPSGKVLLGLGFYGRSFTLANPGCNTPGCQFQRTNGRDSGGAKAGECTGNSGTLSNREINRIIKAKSVNVIYDDAAKVNWMTWDQNQWISFDDARTLKEKGEFANHLCMGGTFAWALDHGGPGTLGRPDQLNGTRLDGSEMDGQDGGSGKVYVSPDIYKGNKPAVQCIPPCTLIMPPYTFSNGVSTLTFPPFETSVQYAWPIGTTVTTLPGVVTIAIDVWHWTITKPSVSGVFGGSTVDGSTTSLLPSILPPPFVITYRPSASNSEGSPNPTTGKDKPPGSRPTDGKSDPEKNRPPGSKPTDGKSDPEKDRDGRPKPRPTDGTSDRFDIRTKTRTITPPPSPYASDTKHDGPNLPTITFKVGPPDPICTANCGSECKGPFCKGPCHDCAGNDDFRDSDDPEPGKNFRSCIGDCSPEGECLLGKICIPFDCLGRDCIRGIQPPSGIKPPKPPGFHKPRCIGPDCVIQICKKLFPIPLDTCKGGCVGVGCRIGPPGICDSPTCMTVGCVGPDCDMSGSTSVCKGPNCTPVSCSGPGCSRGRCQEGASECKPGGSESDKDKDCKVPEKARICTEFVRKTQTKKNDKNYSSTTSTRCSTYTACTAEPTTITSAKTIDSSHVETAHVPLRFVPDSSNEDLDRIASKIEDRLYSWDLERMVGTKTKPKPTSKPKCVCTENGCTGPPCCSSGTCGPDVESPPPTDDGKSPITEHKVKCFDKGATVPQGDLVAAGAKFCRIHRGKTLDYDDPKNNVFTAWRGAHCHDLGCFAVIELKLTAKKGCKMKIDGGKATDVCGSSWRHPIDKCDQNGIEFKQGGTYETACAIWRIDPVVKPVIGAPEKEETFDPAALAW